MLFHTVFFFQTKHCPVLWHVIIEFVSRLAFSGYMFLYVLYPGALNRCPLGYSDVNLSCMCCSMSIMLWAVNFCHH